MIVDCCADLHGFYPELKGGDLLIIAGDLTARDTEREYEDFWRWLCYQNYKKCIVIAGNHDTFIQSNPDFLLDCGENIDYLCDSGTEFEGSKIWGSPWTKTFKGMNPHCKAFTVDTDEELAEKWALIPDDIDILISHCPPYDYLDNIKTKFNDSEHVGSESLYNRVTEIYPKLHIFGHIHEGYGQEIHDFYPNEGKKTITFVNASHVNEDYKPVNKPIRIEL